MLAATVVRRLAILIAFLIVFWSGLFLLLPYDSPILLFLRFNTQRTASLVKKPFADPTDQWLLSPPKFPVTVDADVAVIVKTGYHTQHRVPALLDALRVPGAVHRDSGVLVVADFSAALNDTTGRSIDIIDVVGAAVAHKALAQNQDDPKVLAWKTLADAIAHGKTEDARRMGAEFGHKLDVMKNMPALEHAWNRLNGRKWFLVIDDDTYVVKPSLELVLGHLDSAKPGYMGSAADASFKERFATGGSAILVSREAMRRLFANGPEAREAVDTGYRESLRDVEVDGDKNSGERVVATVFRKAGVYLDERYSHFFNGDRPAVTRVRPDRFCSPLTSFHGLDEPEQMAEAGELFANATEPVFWGQLWKIYGMPPLEAYDRDSPPRLGYDHVGVLGGGTNTIEKVASPEACRDACVDRDKSCLAWTWERASGKCHTSPWIIVGEGTKRYSGINVAKTKQLMGKCKGASGSESANTQVAVES